MLGHYLLCTQTHRDLIEETWVLVRSVQNTLRSGAWETYRVMESSVRYIYMGSLMRGWDGVGWGGVVRTRWDEAGRSIG